jgi:uncharacterized protein YndB with AHSA1/START domain
VTGHRGRYRFDRVLTVGASPPDVFAALTATEDWPRWWPWLDEVTTVDGDPTDRRRRTQRFVVRAPGGYRVRVHGRFVVFEPPRRLIAELTGDLEGTGTLLLRTARAGATEVHYLLDVRTTKLWMNLLAPLAARIFAHNHEVVVDEAFAGLERKLTAGDP